VGVGDEAVAIAEVVQGDENYEADEINIFIALGKIILQLCRGQRGMNFFQF